tara:strand:+ start:1514 stop:2293 length:780 start_codon:yes stop_codon:yes gene_type:complete
MFRTIKLIVAYDGASYVGWQRQENGKSIQAYVEEAIGRIEGRHVGITSAGRTDAGVHAIGQVASVQMHSEIGTAALVRALNASLPRDIRILQAQEATSDFNARRTVKSKHYQYRIIVGDSISPFEYRYAWHMTQNLDCSAMLAAGALLEGEHDFAAFQAAHSSVKTTLRRILRLEISRCSLGDRTIDPFPVVDGSLVTIDIEGNGFLRHMVRIIVGTLVDIGTGRRPPESIKHIIQNRDRSEAGPTAPARGLFLVRVNY